MTRSSRGRIVIPSVKGIPSCLLSHLFHSIQQNGNFWCIITSPCRPVWKKGKCIQETRGKEYDCPIFSDYAVPRFGVGFPLVSLGPLGLLLLSAAAYTGYWVKPVLVISRAWSSCKKHTSRTGTYRKPTYPPHVYAYQGCQLRGGEIWG